MNEPIEMKDSDSIADAVAAVLLVLLFVAACLFWVSGQ